MLHFRAEINFALDTSKIHSPISEIILRFALLHTIVLELMWRLNASEHCKKNFLEAIAFLNYKQCVLRQFRGIYFFIDYIFLNADIFIILNVTSSKIVGFFILFSYFRYDDAFHIYEQLIESDPTNMV